MFQSLLY